MGDFYGHITPGGFFIVFGLAWLIGAFRKYQKTKFSRKYIFKSSLSSFSDNYKANLEGLIILFCSCVGIFIETFYHMLIGEILMIHNYQHAIMYAFFGLAGLILVLKRLLSQYLPEIEKIVYCSFSIAFLITGLLFQLHLWGRDELDKLVHSLLTYLLYFTSIIILLEMNYMNSPLLSLMRCCGSLLTGTWISQIGFILYNPFNNVPKSETPSKHDLMTIGLIFSVHIISVFISVLVIGIVIAVFYKRKHVKSLSRNDLNDNVYKDLLLETDDNI